MAAPPPAPQQNIKVVNAIDAGHMISEALNTSHGERALVNYIRSNNRVINQALKA